MTELDENLTPDERAFLKEFARNYVSGRRLMCAIARVIVALGAIAAPFAAVFMAWAMYHQSGK